jgi:hypothetical protein
MTLNEKRLNAFYSNRAKKSITVGFSIYFKVYFLTIFAYILFKVPQLIYVGNVFRHLNLSGVPLMSTICFKYFLVIIAQCVVQKNVTFFLNIKFTSAFKHLIVRGVENYLFLSLVSISAR